MEDADGEIDDLITNCTVTWTTCNGVYGQLVTGKGVYASKSIFLPAAGFGYNDNLGFSGSNGYYWSATPDPDDPYGALRLFLGSGKFHQNDGFNSRYYGRSVRPLR